MAHRPAPTDLSRVHARSTVQKAVFWGLHMGIVAFAVWLALLGGLERLTGGAWSFGDPVRARILVLCALLYALRHFLTLFYLLMRQVAWGEVFGLLAFMALFEIGLLLVGGGAFHASPIPLGGLDMVALGLLLVGSYLNTFSEIQRKWWKADAANKGHCYTQGLFRHSMHINFFGDMVLFTGWCLFTHTAWTLALPLLMSAMFVFLHIPGLDRYLADRYGVEFTAYAAKTKKLIPFVY